MTERTDHRHGGRAERRDSCAAAVVEREPFLTRALARVELASEEGLEALDAIIQDPPGPHRLGTAPTLADFETAFYRLETAGNSSFEQRVESGSLDARQRANRSWTQLAAVDEPPPIDVAVDPERRDLVEHRKSEHPGRFT